jgi:hypothetical protein
VLADAEEEATFDDVQVVGRAVVGVLFAEVLLVFVEAVLDALDAAELALVTHGSALGFVQKIEVMSRVQLAARQRRSPAGE